MDAWKLRAHNKDAVQLQLRWTQGEYELLREELQRRGHNTSHIPPALPLFRLPYGRCNNEALHIIAQEGLRII